MSLHHSFNIEYAQKYNSVEIALLIHHFQHWIMINKRMKRHLIEGRTWSYQTLKEISACFPYWSIKQIERFMVKMVEMEILIKGNFNKCKYDRTCWYAFKDEIEFSISRFREMEESESGDLKPENGTPIPDSLPYSLEEPNLTSSESSQVLACAEILRKKSFEINDVKSGCKSEELLSEEEVNKIINTYSPEIIKKAALNCVNRKKKVNGKLGPIQSEKAYFLDSLKKFKNGVYK